MQFYNNMNMENYLWIELTRNLVHYGLHFLFPIVIALIFFRDKWRKAYLIMLCTMIVDIDHLFATPIFDPNRCSIGFHFLHSYYAIAFYLIGVLFVQTRIVSVGLVFHMITDYQDCLWS